MRKREFQLYFFSFFFSRFALLIFVTKGKKKKLKKYKQGQQLSRLLLLCKKGASPSSGLTLASRSFEHQSIGCSFVLFTPVTRPGLG